MGKVRFGYQHTNGLIFQNFQNHLGEQGALDCADGCKPQGDLVSSSRSAPCTLEIRELDSSSSKALIEGKEPDNLEDLKLTCPERTALEVLEKRELDSEYSLGFSDNIDHGFNHSVCQSNQAFQR